jgi:ubiquinone/menaquinone biosynthesis C-methylase UbiE
MQPKQRNPHTETRWELNRRHWTENLDPQNLGSGRRQELAALLDLYETADFLEARLWLYPLVGKRLLDLGGGLGLSAILLAREGAQVVVADLSLERLRAAKAAVEEAGVAESVTFVCCSADALPFRDSCFDRQFTKSVLIHVPLEATSKELARTLDSKGSAAFVEPTKRNPFVQIYRLVAAPREWRHITAYFGAREIGVVRAAMKTNGRQVKVTSLYFVAFFATALNFALPVPYLYKRLEALLLSLDSLIYRLLPSARRLNWFSLILVGPRRR